MISFQRDGFYVLDRGYTDFERLYRIHTSGAFFVIRAKDNLHFSRVKSDLTNKSEQVLCDQTIKLNNYYSSLDYPIHLRRIKFLDKENNMVLIFLSTILSASQPR